MGVTDVLRDRMPEPAGFERMAGVSIAAHGVLVAIILLAPGVWPSSKDDAAKVLMTITFGGGTAGPASGGETALGGRPVQEVQPPEEKPAREAARPPAANTPEMTLPNPKVKPTKAAPAATVKNAPDEARGRTPTRGEQTRAGTAVADTGVRGQGFGLSTGGGTTGGGSYLDVANFCCPEYIQTMSERIKANWQPQGNFVGQAMVKFTIQRDGTIINTELEKSSGAIGPDLTAQRAIGMTKTLPPLPAKFPNPTLTVHLSFEYQ